MIQNRPREMAVAPALLQTGVELPKDLGLTRLDNDVGPIVLRDLQCLGGRTKQRNQRGGVQVLFTH